MDFGLKVPEGSADYVLQKRADLALRIKVIREILPRHLSIVVDTGVLTCIVLEKYKLLYSLVPVRLVKYLSTLSFN